MRRALGLLLVLSALGCPAPPECSQSGECDDQNPCTVDSCTAGACVNSADDALAPPQAAENDCVRQACSGGQIVDLEADNETPPQAGAACLLEVCQDGEIVGSPAPQGGGACGPGEYCDADAGCRPSLRDLAQSAPDAIFFGDAPQARLTDFTGLAVADLDGDGDVDLALSEPDTDVTGPGLRFGAGEVHLVDGPLAVGTVDLAQGTSIVISGAAAGDRTGLALAACDFSGDGQADLLISAPNASPNGLSNAGVVFGLLGPIDADVDLAAGPDLVLTGAEANTFGAGRLLCRDLNGDGVDDLVLGAENISGGGRQNAGEALIYLGGASLIGERSFGNADITVFGHSAEMHLGGALAAADLDGDGRPDLALGAPRMGAGQLRTERVVVLSSDVLFDAAGAPLGPVIDLSASNAPGAFLEGGSREQFGFSLIGGDFDGDGLEDLAIGALLSDPNTRQDAGEVDIVYGQPGFSSLDLDLDASRRTLILGFEAGDEMGIALGAGDHNGDGFDDLLVGAHLADGINNERPASGEALLFLGGTPLAPGQGIDLTSTANGPGLVLFGATATGALGKQLQIADVNGDQKGDLLLASPLSDGPFTSPRPDAGDLTLVLAP